MKREANLQEEIVDVEPEEERTGNSPLMRFSNRLLLHIFCILIYLLPIINESTGKPVLDEIHITQEDNRDVNGETSLKEIFSNDYWGRPMNSPSSHKSWRPLTILTFRYLKGGGVFDTLFAHRLVNVITHACIAELVGLLAVKLVPMHGNIDILHTATKVIFALHPTHVEVTANAANRPHLLALLCSVLLSDPSMPILIFPILLLCGYLSCETFIFQTAPIIVTLCAIHYINRNYAGTKSNASGLIRQAIETITAMSLRIILTTTSAFVYYGLRYHYDTLSIPEGLIRPAENPFFRFEGWDRVRNYLYVTSVHFFKSWDLDFLGFSHEYGFECIQKLESWNDVRLLIPAAILFVYVFIALILLLHLSLQSRWTIAFILFTVHCSWMITLFPITGVVKVGTFIADRLVVASSVGVSILLGNAASSWLVMQPDNKAAYQRKLTGLLFVAAIMWHRIHGRTVEWMDFRTLLESSLRTCPRFAKANLELSKIYSGVYPDMTNMTKSREFLDRAFELDPDFCDIHSQAYQVALQEQKYAEFEEHLTQALLCPFTMGGAKSLWDRYWQMAMSNANPGIVQAAQRRQSHYIGIINEALEKEKEKEESNTHSSPLVGWKKR